MTTINQDNIESVAAKLEDFAQGLSDDERAVLGYVLARAESAEEAEVEGFVANLATTNFNMAPQLGTLKPGLPSQLGRSAGLGKLPGGAQDFGVTVSWSW